MCFCEASSSNSLPDKSDSPAVADNVAASVPPLPQPVIQQAWVINNNVPLALSVWLMLKICVLVAAFTSSVSAR